MKKIILLLQLSLLLSLSFCSLVATAYPLDSYERTDIRRLNFGQLSEAGELRGRKVVAGARLSSNEITLLQQPVTLPQDDAQFSQRLKEIVMEEGQSYSIAVLDITDPNQLLLGEFQATEVVNVGSVGKLLVMLTLLQTLADVYPENIAKRESVLKNTEVITDKWGLDSSHEVVLFDPPSRKMEYRKFRVGDRGNLWEYCDWMMSASNNGATNLVIKNILLLDHFREAYPPKPDAAEAYIQKSSPKILGEQWLRLMKRTVQNLGLDPAVIMQGNGFSSVVRQKIAGQSSHASAKSLLQVMLAIETGAAVDAWSSLEAKRLMYLTEKRIRYASHPNLNTSAVYFKSGSFYSCGGQGGCGKYMGAKVNRLASVVLVESPATESQANPLRYIAVVMSNVLRVNSADSHRKIAGRVHRLIQSQHLKPTEGAMSVVPTEQPNKDTVIDEEPNSDDAADRAAGMLEEAQEGFQEGFDDEKEWQW